MLSPPTLPPSPNAPGLPPGVTVIPMYPLYSPGQVTAAAIFGGPLAAAWLMAINFRRLGAPRKAITLVALATLGMLGLIWLAIHVPTLPHAVNVAVPVTLILLHRSLQLEDFRSHVARQGRIVSTRRAFGVIVGMLAVSAALLAPFVIAQVWQSSIIEGNCQVIYRDGATVEEAHAICKELVELQVISDHVATINISRPDGRAVVELVVGDEFRNKPEIVHDLHALAEPLSTTVFHGQHVDIYLDDDLLEPKVKLIWEDRPLGDP